MQDSESWRREQERDQLDAMPLEQLVREMRKAQREFFSGRQSDTLERAKRYERAVDRMLEQMKSGQEDLFNG